MATVKMYDATRDTLSQIPADAGAVASYVDNYGGYSEAKRMFPNIPVVSISVTPGNNVRADIYDVEPHGKSVGEAIDAIASGRAGGAYGGAGDLQAIQSGLARRGIHRNTYKLWIAAWPGSGPNVTPGYDAHQYEAYGGSNGPYDISIALDSFFQGGASGSNPSSGGGSSNGTQFVIDRNTDYWAGCCSLAQQAQLYLFSDAETMYLLDGKHMVAQEPVAIIDRSVIGTSNVHGIPRFGTDSISHMEFSYDNSAFQGTSTHTRKGKNLKQTALAKVQSPTSGSVDLICSIDFLRAGDTVFVNGAGFCNGIWVVGDVTRSVFDVKSTISLVPAMAPLGEYEVAGAGSSSTGGSSSGGSGGTFSGDYPLAQHGQVIGWPYQGTHTLGNWQSDNAVDIAVPVGTDVIAVEDGQIRADGMWNTGYNPSSRFSGLDVPLYGVTHNFWYTHMSQRLVNDGQHVKKGDVIGKSGEANGVAHLHFAVQPPANPVTMFHLR